MTTELSIRAENVLANLGLGWDENYKPEVAKLILAGKLRPGKVRGCGISTLRELCQWASVDLLPKFHNEKQRMAVLLHTLGIGDADGKALADEYWARIPQMSVRLLERLASK